MWGTRENIWVVENSRFVSSIFGEQNVPENIHCVEHIPIEVVRRCLSIRIEKQRGGDLCETAALDDFAARDVTRRAERPEQLQKSSSRKSRLESSSSEVALFARCSVGLQQKRHSFWTLEKQLSALNGTHELRGDLQSVVPDFDVPADTWMKKEFNFNEVNHSAEGEIQLTYRKFSKESYLKSI